MKHLEHAQLRHRQHEQLVPVHVVRQQAQLLDVRHLLDIVVGHFAVGVALVGLALALYLLTPENYLTVRQALPGAIFFAVGWIIATKLFQLYVVRYDRYNPTYLALASIIVLLTWMYLTCLLLLLGGKLNAIIRRQREKMRVVEPLAAAPAAPVA